MSIKKIYLFLAILSTCFLNTSIAHAINYCTNGQLGGGWKFDEASGTLSDCTGNSNTATGHNVTEGVAGKYNNGVSFGNNNSDYVSASASATLNNLATISMGAWINPNSFGKSGNRCSGATIISKTDASHGPELCMGSSGAISFEANWSGGGVQWTTTTNPIITGSWQHVAVTYSYSSTSNKPTIYYNGTALTVGSASPFGSQGSDSGNGLSIGNETAGGGVGGGFDGTIDEPFWGNIVFTFTDINNIMNNGIDGSQGSTPVSNFTTINNAVINNATIN